MNNIIAMINDVTVTRLATEGHREIDLEWKTPTIILGKETTTTTLSYMVSPTIKLGDKGKLLNVDGYWKFQADSSYYKNELQKTLSSILSHEGDIPTMVVTSSSGFTKNLSINLESIDHIRRYLDIVEHKLQGGR